MKRSALFLLIFLLGLAGLLHAQAPEGEPSSQPPPTVVIADMEGVIGPAQADWMDRALREAADRGAGALLLRLDTPGGLSESMRSIIQSILGAPMPVLCWVGPGGARAASAGTFILYACHISAMAPGTNLGAATPVQIGGGGLPGSPSPEQPAGSEGEDSEASGEKPSKATEPQSALERKAMEDAVAYIRSLADLRGRNGDWAEEAVREGASLPAEAAVDREVVDFQAASPEEVLRQAEGRTVATAGGEVTLHLAQARTVRVEPGFRLELLQALANPNVAYILMLIGIYGLIFELANPGAIVPGVLGGICLLLAMYAFQTLPVNYAGLGLMALGILFFVGEALVPSFGALGVGGLIAFVLGSIMLIDTDVPALEIAWPVIATAGLVTAAFILAVATMAAKSHRRQPVSGSGHLVGHVAVTVEPLNPEGRVRFEGELWRARADSPIESGRSVRITGMDGLTLHVAPAEEAVEEE